MKSPIRELLGEDKIDDELRETSRYLWVGMALFIIAAIFSFKHPDSMFEVLTMIAGYFVWYHIGYMKGVRFGTGAAFLILLKERLKKN